MGYDVSYGSIPTPKAPKTKKWTSIAALVVVLVLVISAFSFKGAVLPWVQEWLIPGDPEVTAMALRTMVDDLRQGVDFADALAAFCGEIIANGQG